MIHLTQSALGLIAASSGRVRPQIGVREILIGIVLTVVVFGVIALVARKLESKDPK